MSPSTLLVDGQNRLGANLKRFMDGTRHLEEAILFIDEFEELASSRDQASQLKKSITNEFLKQVPLFKAELRQNLLVCATHYIRQLDVALLRPGRFDCIIPVGSLDDQSRRTIFNHYLLNTNCSHVDVNHIIAQIPLFTMAEIDRHTCGDAPCHIAWRLKKSGSWFRRSRLNRFNFTPISLSCPINLSDCSP